MPFDFFHWAILGVAPLLIVAFMFRSKGWIAALWIPLAAVSVLQSFRVLQVVGANSGPGMDPRLERIGYRDLLLRYFLLQNLKQPVPIHARLKNDSTLFPSPYQLPELLRPGVFDPPPLQHLSVPVDHAKHAVALVKIDSNIHGFLPQ